MNHGTRTVVQKKYSFSVQSRCKFLKQFPGFDIHFLQNMNHNEKYTHKKKEINSIYFKQTVRD
jgi:hypothetical protein